MTGAKKEKVRVLFTRHLMEGHEFGMRLVAMKCRDYGMEVVYLARFYQMEEVARAAQEEDVAVIGLTSSSGAHFFLARELLRLLKEREMDTVVIMGGVIPNEATPGLLELGINKIFGPGTSPDEAAKYILELTSIATV